MMPSLTVPIFNSNNWCPAECRDWWGGNLARGSNLATAFAREL